MSNLRYSTSTSSLPSQITRQTSPSSPVEKKMSLTQTYVLAHTARSKLSREASRPTHNLRRLVGHANMLDNLMLDLANAEQEQESWFNQSVKTASKAEEPKHVKWAETIPEQAMEDDSDSESDSEEDTFEIAQHLPIRRVRKSPVPPPPSFDEDDDMEVDDEYDASLALARTSSHPPEATPELMHEDSDSESEDESLPPSPPTQSIPFDAFTEKQRQSIGSAPIIHTATTLSETDHDFFQHSLPAPIAAY